MKSTRPQIAGLVGILALSLGGAATAAPVTFSGTMSSFTLGAGYGDDGAGAEATGTLLEVVFTGLSGFASGSLSAGSPPLHVNVGTVSFQELSILPAETDDLGVTANFTFLMPVSGVLQVSATGVAVAGITIDAATDLTITWTGIDVPFGNGGLFRVDVDPLVFSTVATANQDIFATITLLAEPAEIGVPPAAVPEPATLALIGLGLAGLGLSRRKGAR